MGPGRGSPPGQCAHRGKRCSTDTRRITVIATDENLTMGLNPLRWASGTLIAPKAEHKLIALAVFSDITIDGQMHKPAVSLGGHTALVIPQDDPDSQQFCQDP